MYALDDEWRSTVRATLERLKKEQPGERWSQAELARRVGCSPPTISTMLGSQKQSELVPKVNKVLGLPPPKKSTGILSDELRRWGESGERASAAGYFEALLEWVAIGHRFAQLGLLDDAIDRIRERVEGAEEAMERSSDSIRMRSADIHAGPSPASDRPDKNIPHGASKPGER